MQRLMEEKEGAAQAPAEDEGIPGHHPGSANLNADATGALNKLSLGPAQMDPDLLEDVKAELSQEDSTHPPSAGQGTFMEQFEQRIKTEPTDDAPPCAPPMIPIPTECGEGPPDSVFRYVLGDIRSMITRTHARTVAAETTNTCGVAEA